MYKVLPAREARDPGSNPDPERVFSHLYQKDGLASTGERVK